MSKRVLIAGASIAGPALAFWLHRYGFSVTVVERAPALRPGGQAVDLRGVGKEIARRMGLDAEIRAACTDTQGVSYVDARNRERARMTADMFDGDGPIAEIEILRGDLSQVLYEATIGGVDYLFDDRIAQIEEDSEQVRVEFASGKRAEFDLVIGADGLHSGLRALVFGPESEYLHDLGYLLAFYTVPNRLELANWMNSYSEPHYSAAMRSIRDGSVAMALLSIPGVRADYDYREAEGQKALLRKHMGQMQWEMPWLLDQLDDAEDFYFDSCSQVHMPSWSKGRIALLGDAAFCASPISGQGTTLAMVGAYILAGELAAADGDHLRAFSSYEAKLREYVAANQKMGVDNAKWFSSKTKLGLWMQYQAIRLMPYIPGKALVMRRMLRVINAIELPDYTRLVKTPV